MLAVHEDKALEVGIEAVFAKAEEEIEIFSGCEMRVVPREVFGQEATTDHDTGVLQGISRIHEVVDSNMGGRENFLTGDMIVFINS